MRLLLKQDTSQSQALDLLRTINRSQLDALAEIAHNLVFNQEVTIDYARKRRKIFEALAQKKRAEIVRRHPLVILRALLLSRKTLLEALRE